MNRPTTTPNPRRPRSSALPVPTVRTSEQLRMYWARCEDIGGELDLPCPSCGAVWMGTMLMHVVGCDYVRWFNEPDE